MKHQEAQKLLGGIESNFCRVPGTS